MMKFIKNYMDIFERVITKTALTAVRCFPHWCVICGET